MNNAMRIISLLVRNKSIDENEVLNSDEMLLMNTPP